MAVSRRIFLRRGVLAAVACAIPVEGWGSQRRPNVSDGPARQTHGPTDAMTKEAFLAAVGSGFKVSQSANDPKTQWLRLIAVEDLEPPAEPNTGLMAVLPRQLQALTIVSGFSLSFTGAVGKELAQGTYNFEHDRMGKFALFIVPGTDGRQSYTAVINHSTSAARVQAVSAGNGNPGLVVDHSAGDAPGGQPRTAASREEDSQMRTEQEEGRAGTRLRMPE